MSPFANWILSACVVLCFGSTPGAVGQVNKILKDFPHGVDCLAFSPDGKILATGTLPSKGGKDAVTLWEVASGKELCRLGDNYLLGCGALAFSPDGKTLVANAGFGDTVLLWDVSSRKIRITLKGKQGFGGRLAISPDSRTLALSGDDPSIRLYDMETGKERKPVEGNIDPRTIIYSPDGKLLAASALRGMVFLWDATGKQRAALDRHDRAVYSLAFSPDSKTLYSLGEDQLLVLWDTATGKERKVMALRKGGRATTYGALSPDGKTFAVLGAGCVRLFDLNREKFWPDVEWDYQDGRQRCIAFSPNGKSLATGSGGDPASNSVYLYAVPEPKQKQKRK